MLRGNLKQVRIEKNPARLRALESAAGETELAPAMALTLAGESAPASAAAADDHPEEEVGFTIDIKSFLKPGEKTYTQRCRLFVGNLPTDITEEDFKRLFERYGEPSEVFINRDRGFGFIRLVRLAGGRTKGRPTARTPSWVWPHVPPWAWGASVPIGSLQGFPGSGPHSLPFPARPRGGPSAGRARPCFSGSREDGLLPPGALCLLPAARPRGERTPCPVVFAMCEP